jgi:hypothetical protein
LVVLSFNSLQQSGVYVFFKIKFSNLGFFIDIQKEVGCESFARDACEKVKSALTTLGGWFLIALHCVDWHRQNLFAV